MITPDILKRLGCPALKAAEYAAALEASRGDGAIDDKLRCAHYLAQTAHETAGYSTLVENLNYRDAVRLDQLFRNVRGIDHARKLIKAGPIAIANCAYAGRGGNGDEASGDGWKYRGRGFIQLTLRDNYAKFERKTALGVVEDPDILLRPYDAAKAAAIYWKISGANAYADRDDVAGVTGVINGPALAGLEDRRAKLKIAKASLGI